MLCVPAHLQLQHAFIIIIIFIIYQPMAVVRCHGQEHCMVAMLQRLRQVCLPKPCNMPATAAMCWESQLGSLWTEINTCVGEGGAGWTGRREDNRHGAAVRCRSGTHMLRLLPCQLRSCRLLIFQM